MDERVAQLLAAGPLSAQVLATRLGVSQPTVSRLLAQQAGRVVALGRARATRYALRQPVRELAAELPVYRVTATGEAEAIGQLHTLAGGYWFEDLLQPRDSAWFDGLPWFLADMRPQGFLGRGYSQRHPELQLPARLSDWQDTHALYALARRGEDVSGNLLVGEESFARWAGGEAATPIAASSRSRRYPRLAEQALAGELAGSSAAGEQPKFAATIMAGGSPQPVLVKFSEPLDTAAGRRWADLLLAEHHALELIAGAGLPAARSRVLEAGGRLFLELQRFDRIGARGRRGLISMAAVDDHFIGERRNWLASALALQRLKLLGEADVQRIAWLQAFGGFIANTDMHYGNCSLHYEGRMPFELAPAYDMLPMLYAPQRGEVRTPVFRPPPPPPRGLAQARDAMVAARRFWEAVADDIRISPPFREQAAAHAQLVAAARW